MDIGLIITSMPGWALFCLIVVVGVLTAEGGAWLARRRTQEKSDEPEKSVSTSSGAMLGLLAFMLGFTFSITSARFAERKQLVIEEANAIGTCYLRTSFIPEKQQQEIRKLFREYTVILIEINRHSALDKQLSRMDEIHTLIWNQTVLLTQEKMDSQLRALFITSVNEVIDLYSERKTVAFTFRIPNVLWTSLLSLFLLSMFSLGYQIGTQSKSGIFDMPLLATSFALVIVLITDMDATLGARKFKVSQQPLIELQQMIEKDSP